MCSFGEHAGERERLFLCGKGREWMKGEGGEKEEVGHGACASVSTGLIANKCLVLEQQALASVVGDLHIMFAIWNKKGHAVPQQSVCCCEER